MVWTPETSCGYESRKIRHLIVPYTRGRGLDLGCGGDKAFPHMIGVDNGNVYGREGVDLVADITDLSMFADNSLDFVFSSHALEDIEDTRAALTEWWRVVRPGGHLVLYLPHKDFYPNIGQPGANPAHKHDFRPEDITAIMREIAEAGDWPESCRQIEDEVRSAGNEYSFFQVYRKEEIDPGQANFLYEPWERRPGGKRRCLVVRYGGIGDVIMASSVLPGLKEQGYHITFNATPKGQAVLLHDPHIDDWWLQDKDQVPNHWLPAYWHALARDRFDKIVNLSESVEKTLLASPGTVQHSWSDDTRRRVLGTVNYLERTHAIAEVEGNFRPAFYPTEAEAEWARRFKAEIAPGGEPVVLWALAGSSVHKTYPHMDAVIARLMLETEARVVLVGDALCQILEQGWENEPRVVRRSGRWGVRETLSFAKVADVVVGPETGVLNAVSHEPAVRKVIMLSHSSHENLTKHWVNTRALAAEVSCYPCHRLHYDRTFCHTHEPSGTAICAANIPPEAVYEAIVLGFHKGKGA